MCLELARLMRGGVGWSSSKVWLNVSWSSIAGLRNLHGVPCRVRYFEWPQCKCGIQCGFNVGFDPIGK